MLSRITGALTRQPCRSSLCGHLRRVGSRLSRITARYLPGRKPGLPPAKIALLRPLLGKSDIEPTSPNDRV